MDASSIIDPLEKYPAALKEAIEAFEAKGLDEACERIRKSPLASNLDYQKGLKEIADSQNNVQNQHALGIWLWSCYFDAHWMCDQIAEWASIHERLYQFLDTDSSWIIFHETLFEKLHDVYQRALKLHQALKGDLNEYLFSEPEWVIKRVKSIEPWLTPSLRDSFRIPLHNLKITPVEDIELFFWDVSCLEKKPLKIGPYYLCSDLLSLCYASTIEKNTLALFFPAEASLQLQTLHQEALIKALEQTSSKELLTRWKTAQAYGKTNLCHSLAHFCRQIQNSARHLRFAHYGSIARMSLLYRYQLHDWNKGLVWRDIPMEEDCLAQQMTLLNQEGLKKRRSRLPSSKKLPRVLHITAQLVDQGHAPSKILYRMLAMGDRERLDQAIIVTESLIQRHADYPGHLRHSTSSEERGRQFLRFMDKEKIAYLVERPNALSQPFESLEQVADRLADRIRPIDADAIIFHGPEPLHHAIASRLEGPLKILFEHGTLPKAPGFDMAICCLEDTLNLSSKALQKIDTRLHILPFAADSRWTWKPEMPQKEHFGIQDSYRIATTISNHLETRLHPDFCLAVSQILKKVPDLFYVPIGRVDNPSELLHRFDKSVHNRIRFLGPQEAPSHLTRCMDIYFNEFPFGSCYGILDAMASGCPVVSMYDPEGPPQARYGGLFMGLEESVSNGSIEGYVEKACKWLQSPLEYFKASQKAFQHYEWRSNYWAYIDQFETFLLQEISAHQRREATREDKKQTQA